MGLQLLLTPAEASAEEYVNGLVRAVATIHTDTGRRRGTVEHGGQELIAWHVGGPYNVTPFRFVEYNEQTFDLMITYTEAFGDPLPGKSGASAH